MIVFFGVASCDASAPDASGPVSLRTEHLQVTIDDTGSITSLYDAANKVEYIAENQPAALLKIRVFEADIHVPSAAAFSEDRRTVTLTYGQAGMTAVVKIAEAKTHLVFELVSISPEEKVDRLYWGPYPTTIGETIGETIGVVRNADFAIGLQSLNVNTDGRADKRDFGSTLEARCRNHGIAQRGSALGHVVDVIPIEGYSMTGSKVALFGCPEPQTLDTIGAIARAEGLPYPMLDGEWAKVSPTATSSYMIIDFSESNFAECLEVTKKAGLRYLYHGEPFVTWGHFKLRENHFPDGYASLKRCVEMAKKENIRLGLHTLSNFITANDPYVTPVPDKRLALTGTSTLINDIDETATEIVVATAEPFNDTQRNWVRTVRIGDELIRYGTVSEEAPWTLLNCRRGSFGTQAASHTAGAKVGKLMDHEYRVFLANLELQHEMAVRLAHIFNDTELKQISFDGLEGCYASGHGDYARMRMVKDWYDHLDNTDNVISDASNPGHYSWHIHTRMNWGEPWYDSFRESQQDYRLKNQAYFERNLMPRMLGWFFMQATTSVDDIEWMLARAAGFDAGFALYTTPPALEHNGFSDAILAAVNNWETARHAKAFTAEQRKAMQNATNEFHLEAVGPREWKLYPVYVTSAMKHAMKVRQPGEPVFSEWTFNNPYETQPLQFILKVVSEKDAEDAVVSNPTFVLDYSHSLTVNVSLSKDQYLVCDGSRQAKVYDNHWNPVKTVAIEDPIPQVTKGERAVEFDADFSKGQTLQVEVNFKTVGISETIKGKVNPPIIQ